MKFLFNFNIILLLAVTTNVIFASKNSTNKKDSNELEKSVSADEVTNEKINNQNKRQATVCNSNPCGQNGQCIPTAPTGYICICNTGYTGAQCQTEINECLSAPCKNGADCFDLVNAFLCNCRTGFTGTFCETSVNNNNVCQPGTCGDGECQLTTHPTYTYVCKCKDNTYSFTACASTTTTCQANSCFNGGTCVSYSATERWCNPSQVGKVCCQCLTGFTGLQCETDIDECASNPCKNGARCNNLVNAYTCSCLPGYIGYNCDILTTVATTTTTTTTVAPLNGCAPNPCANGGTCVPQSNGAFLGCFCALGFTGTFCQTQSVTTTTTTTTTTPSTPVLCPNQAICNLGVCYIVGNTFSCVCPQGYAGTFCETLVGGTTTTTVAPLNGCAPNPCTNGGTCVTQSNGAFFGCFCATGYIGTFCQTFQGQITTTTTTSSTPTLCANQAQCNLGVCYNIGTSIRCVCPEGYTGTFCQTFVGVATTVAPSSGCSPNPCLNGGTCVSQSNGAFYGCFCTTGYIGTYCQTLQSAQTTTVSTPLTCSPNPCRNSGTCVSDSAGRFYGCFCVTGYIGTYCERV